MAFMAVMTAALLVVGVLSMSMMTRGSNSRRSKFGALLLGRAEDLDEHLVDRMPAARGRVRAQRIALPLVVAAQVIQAIAPVLVSTSRHFFLFHSFCLAQSTALAALAFWLSAGCATWGLGVGSGFVLAQ
jgi:hypothetical protein